jgi:hypothetical protein
MHTRPVFRNSDRWFAFGLIAIVLIMYGASISFGLIWDDPTWYQQGAGQTPWQILTALPTYQFYRPLAIILNRQLVAPTGIVAAQLAHIIQVIAHLMATLACVPVARAFKLGTWHARMTALVFAIFPFSYQAVAWEAPQQPIAMLAVLVAILAADRFIQHGRIVVLIGSLAAYGFALLFQESTLPFVFAFFFLAIINRSSHKQRLRAWPILHLALASLFFLIWLNVPRQGGITGRGLQANVLAYILQGVTFPIASLFAAPLTYLPLAGLIAAFTLIWLLLTMGIWRWHSLRAVALSALWIAAGLLPIWIGLSWSYVRIGSRLLYPAAFGIALLWGGWMAVLFSQRHLKWQRAIGGIATIIVIGVSFQQWTLFQRLYQTGVQHLDRTIEVLAARPEAHLLFVNYPDRIELLPQPYPVGNWGLTLAPIVQDLSGFARAKVGVSAADRSLSAFQIGADQRGVWPYAVFMRGEDSDAIKLFAAISQSDRVYLTDYPPEGSLRLRDVGGIRSASSSSPFIAAIGETVRINEAKLSVSEDLTLEITWQCFKPANEGDTIFVHVWKDNAFISAHDGDALGGLIPLSVCPNGTEIIDVRHIPLNDLAPGHYKVRAGVYNRLDGSRYPAFAANSDRAPDDEVSIGTFDVP